MEKEYLFNNEQIISQSDDNLITLTNLRLRYGDTNWGKSKIISILLKNISSIEVSSRSNPFLALLSIISVTAGIYFKINGEIDEYLYLGLVLGLAFAVWYIFSIKHFITISSFGGAKINFVTKGMKHYKVLEFINQVEGAIIELNG